MRCIGSLSDSVQARRFGDFLVAEGVANQVEEGGGGRWDVWVLNDDQLDEARRELARFEAEPGSSRYDGVDSEARRIRAAERERADRLRRNYTDVRTQWGRASSVPVVTLVLVVLAVIVAAGTRIGAGDTPMLNWLLFAPYKTAVEVPEDEGTRSTLVGSDVDFRGEGMFDAIARGEAWRLLTPAFIHFGPLHLVFNLYWLFRFGQTIEPRKGAVFFTLVVLVGAVICNVAEALWIQMSPFNEGVRYAAFGGLSGVNYALFGYAWLAGKRRPHEHIGVDPQTALILFAWLVLCMTGMLGPIANAAHVAGLLVGIAVAQLNPRLPRAWRPA